MTKEKGSGMSRRNFLGTTAAATAAFTIVPSRVVSGMGHVAPSDKLNIAGVGVGGMGFANLKNIKDQNIVALCDVDWKYAARCFDHYVGALTVFTLGVTVETIRGCVGVRRLSS